MVLISLEKPKALDFVDVVYESTLEPFYYHQDNYEHLILMEDGAPVHSSRIVANWRTQIGLQKLQWPANSLDLNPIENLWKVCKDRVQNMTQPKSKDEMWNHINAT